MIMTVTEELRQEDRHSIQVESIGRMLKAGLPGRGHRQVFGHDRQGG